MMAWTITLAVLSLATAVSASIFSRDNDSSSTSPMFLPLFVNNHPLLHREDIFSRRRLLNSTTPNARMPLYGDLILNEHYSTRLWIGTPPQQFSLIVDTESTITFVPCSTCDECGQHQDPRFQPELSRTYKPVKCNNGCTCDNERMQCIYKRQYTFSTSRGVLGKDTFSFGNQSDLKPQRAVFGCENRETGPLFRQHADGIMGLGRGKLSIVDQLVKKNVISDSFSLCYGGMGVAGGAMVLGGISPPADMVFTRSDPARSPYYNIHLSEIHVAGKKLPINPSVFDGRLGTVISSGTTYAYLPKEAFGAFKEAIFKEVSSLKRIPGPDPNYDDICFSGAGSDAALLSKAFPAVEMVFYDGQKLLLSPENFLFRHMKVDGAYCLGIFQSEMGSIATTLGAIIFRNTLVTYDREHEKIGFWKTNCSELWEKLHLSPIPTTTPLPSSTHELNSTINLGPMLAPTEPPLAKAPGEVKIGLITFSMLLTLKYTELKPHISELAESIAKGLDVNASQVQLVNFTCTENDTLIRWSIFPAKSDDYISNTTAMDIISRLNEDRLHLPESFGKYKLLEWKIEPSPERTWWQQHYLALVVAFLLVIVVGLVASGTWIIRSRNKNNSPGVYEVVAAQELQALHS